MILNLLAVDLQQAFASIETWVAAGFAVLASSGAGGVIMGLISRLLTKKVNKQTTVSEEKIEEAANASAEKAVKKMVGKSFNVNIKSEVDKAVKAELKPIRENAEYAATASRNAEIATAHVLLAQSRSRLLNEDEQANLQLIAKKILAHANGEVASPTIIEISDASTETATVADVKETNEVKGAEPDAVDENASLVSFADVG